MDDLDFSEAEICQELEKLGYQNLPLQRIKEFKRDLEQLIRQDRSSGSLSTSNDSSSLFHGDDRAPTRVYLQDKSNVHMQQKCMPEYSAPCKGSGAPQMVSSIRHSADYINAPKSRSSNIPQERQRPTTGDPTKKVSLKSCLKNSEYVTKPVDISSSTVTESSAWDQSTDQSADSTRLSERRQIKRKVLRKINGHVEVNELMTEDDSSIDGRDNYLPSRHAELSSRPLSAPPAISESSHRLSSREPSIYSLPDGYEGPKALIRPLSCDPHMKNIKKSDPVARYQQYQHGWNVCRAPGEKSHKQLRWGVREQMLYHDQVVVKKPQPVHQPNGYVIPSDKKRKALRWQIRADLANGIKPSSVFD